MTANYEDWLFQPFEIDYSEPFDEKDPRVQRDVARFYYQGYSETDILNSMKIKNVKMLLDSCDKALWNFLQTVHDRNRALLLWVFQPEEREYGPITDDERDHIKLRNAVRQYLKGPTREEIAAIIPDADILLNMLEEQSPALWEFIHKHNQAVNEQTPFQMDKPTTVFVWNLQAWKLKDFADFAGWDEVAMQKRLDDLRDETTSTERLKYEVDTAVQSEMSFGGTDAVRRVVDRVEFEERQRSVLHQEMLDRARKLLATANAKGFIDLSR
jgi:hypothetical protein